MITGDSTRLAGAYAEDTVMLTATGAQALREARENPPAWEWDILAVTHTTSAAAGGGLVRGECEVIDSLAGDLNEACAAATALNRMDAGKGGGVYYLVRRHVPPTFREDVAF